MGIVNVTPDSFSGDGVESASDATAHATRAVARGRAICSTSAASRRVRVIVALRRKRRNRARGSGHSLRFARPFRRRRFRSTRTSPPSCAPRTRPARISSTPFGERRDALLDVVAELEMPIVAMHNQSGTQYDGPVVDAVLGLSRRLRIERAVARGHRSASESFSIPGSASARRPSRISPCLEALPRLVGARLPDADRHVAKIYARQADRAQSPTIASTQR